MMENPNTMFNTTTGRLSKDEIFHIVTVVKKHQKELKEHSQTQFVPIVDETPHDQHTDLTCRHPELQIKNSRGTLVSPPSWIVDTLCSFLYDSNDAPLNTLLSQPTTIEKDVYEGGNQLWECSTDMLCYMSQRLSCMCYSIQCSKEPTPAVHLSTLYPVSAHFQFFSASSPVSLLELGCGYGLPSLAFMLYRRHHDPQLKNSFVTLQDLNRKSLELSAIPTAFLTLSQYYSFEDTLDILLHRCRFVYGSWNHLSLREAHDLLSTSENQGLFDTIISCEGLYRCENFPYIKAILYNHLKPLNVSQAFFATKRYYYGIGGGTYPFLRYLECSQMECIKNESSCSNDAPDPATIERLLFSDANCVTSKQESVTFNNAIPHTPRVVSNCSSVNQDEEKSTIQADTSSPSLVSNISFTIQDGISNTRDILVITWNQI